MEKKRPLGVTILATLFIIFGIFSIFGLIFHFPVFQCCFPDQKLTREKVLYSIIPIIPRILGLTLLVLGIGLLKLKQYIRRAAVIFLILYIPLGFFNLYGDISYLASYSYNIRVMFDKDILTRLVIDILSAPAIGFYIYLIRPKIKEQFK